MTVMNLASSEADIDLDASHTLFSSAFDVSPYAQFIVDNNGFLAMFNERACSLFSLIPGDAGRPIQDLELSYRPVELRSPIAQALDQRRPILIRDVQLDAAAREPRYFDVHVAAVNGHNSRPLGVSITFVEISRVHELQMQLSRSKHDLETAYEELQSTNEELETTNEELQSTVEELETTNEELQSTNEELETMNEELQSTNEELQTINEELRQRSEDLNRANALFQSILAGVRSAVVVVDRELLVVAWNHRAEDLWGLRNDEVRGQNFLNLDIGLPVERLVPAIRSCLKGERDHSEISVDATNRPGKMVACKVTVSPLAGAGNEVRGAILLMDEQTVTIN
jgi:two-component system CheB/CheR fusion protein